jgi:hypothetical protein
VRSRLGSVWAARAAHDASLRDERETQRLDSVDRRNAEPARFTKGRDLLDAFGSYIDGYRNADSMNRWR